LHYPSGRPDLALASTLPGGVPTFLGTLTACRGYPAHSPSPISGYGGAILVAMLASFLSSATPTVPPPSTPVAQPAPAVDTGGTSTVSDVVTTVVENLGNNGYQTGVALVVATVAVVAMLNLKVHRFVIAPVAVGAFWAGWLGWNTFSGDDQPLFPGDVSATKLWDVAFTSDTGFLLVAGVACIAAVFLWRTGTTILNRAVLILGAVLGASFLYNLVEAFRAGSA